VVSNIPVKVQKCNARGLPKMVRDISHFIKCEIHFAILKVYDFTHSRKIAQDFANGDKSYGNPPSCCLVGGGGAGEALCF